jgi:hypothetical protein
MDLPFDDIHGQLAARRVLYYLAQVSLLFSGQQGFEHFFRNCTLLSIGWLYKFYANA